MTTRIITPFDAFMSDTMLWLSTAWYLWVVLGIIAIAVVVGIVARRARSRGYDSVPHYSRSDT
ncbi:MAG: hypothetical protein ACOH1K_00620 [Rhodoglobus sp.]